MAAWVRHYEEDKPFWTLDGPEKPYATITHGKGELALAVVVRPDGTCIRQVVSRPRLVRRFGQEKSLNILKNKIVRFQ
jgi:hypothetical protein